MTKIEKEKEIIASSLKIAKQSIENAIFFAVEKKIELKKLSDMKKVVGYIDDILTYNKTCVYTWPSTKTEEV